MQVPLAHPVWSPCTGEGDACYDVDFSGYSFVILGHLSCLLERMLLYRSNSVFTFSFKMSISECILARTTTSVMNDTPMGHNDPTDSSSSTRDPLYFQIDDNTDVGIMKNFGGGGNRKNIRGVFVRCCSM